MRDFPALAFQHGPTLRFVHDRMPFGVTADADYLHAGVLEDPAFDNRGAVGEGTHRNCYISSHDQAAVGACQID